MSLLLPSADYHWAFLLVRLARLSHLVGRHQLAKDRTIHHFKITQILTRHPICFRKFLGDLIDLTRRLGTQLFERRAERLFL
jgi:hypothetical protein